MANLNDLTKKFLLGENQNPPNLMSYVQALNEILNNLQPNTIRETRRLEIAKQHLREIKKHANRLLEENKTLQEQLNVLEEEKVKKGKK